MLIITPTIINEALIHSVNKMRNTPVQVIQVVMPRRPELPFRDNKKRKGKKI